MTNLRPLPIAPENEQTENLADSVRRCFTLGWHIAVLYGNALMGVEALGLHHGPELPGLRRLRAEDLGRMGIDQIDVALRSLEEVFVSSGLDSPKTASLRQLLESGDLSSFRDEIFDLHVRLLTKLTAADERCGTAYGLGRALADLCGAAQTPDDLADHLNTNKAAELTGWLSDLQSWLPDHSAEVVRRSLQAWVEWASSNPPQDFDWRSAALTSRGLHEQGQRWRALLSGEKIATEVLGIDDFVTVSATAARRAGAITRRAAPSFWPVLLVTFGLLGVGLGLVIAASGWARVLAGLGLVAGSLIVARRGIGPAVGFLTPRVTDSIWGASLDIVIAEKIRLSFPKIARHESETAVFSARQDDTTVFVPVHPVDFSER